MTESERDLEGVAASADEQLLYGDGRWTRMASPLPPDEDDWVAAVRQAGYTQFFSSGNIGYNTLSVTVYQAPDAGPFLMSFDSSSSYQVLYAATFPDVMDLLSKWAPVLTVDWGDLLTRINNDGDTARLIRQALRHG